MNFPLFLSKIDRDYTYTDTEVTILKTILIVDDDVYIGDMLEEFLTKENYAVGRAYSGTEALLYLSSRRPDLILLDLMLPGLSGEELLPLIKDIPVIIVSAKAEVSDKVDLLLGGAADYITKPLTLPNFWHASLYSSGKTPAGNHPESSLSMRSV